MDGDEMAVTRDQAEALATLAANVRAEAKTSRWDKPGIMTAIGRVKDRTLADVALAVIRAADDPTLDTPGAIGNPTTSCWAERATRHAAFEPYDPAAFCGTCGKPELTCRRNEHSGHEFIRAVDRDRRARAHVTTEAPAEQGVSE